MAQDAMEMLRNPEASLQLRRQNTTSASIRCQLQDIEKLIEMKKTSDINSVITFARNTFNDIFDHTIRDRIQLWPSNHKDRSGIFFWSGKKRFPNPVVFDAKDEMHLDFVLTCSNLIFAILGKSKIERAECLSIISAMSP